MAVCAGTILAGCVAAAVAFAPHGALAQSTPAPSSPPANSPPASKPGGAPALRPPPRERIKPPEDLYKPIAQRARNDPDVDPAAAPADPAAVPADAPLPTVEAPTFAPEDAADASLRPIAPSDSTSATPAPAATLPPAVLAPAPKRALTVDDMVIIGVLAAIVIVPLILGCWWILLSKRNEATAASDER